MPWGTGRVRARSWDVVVKSSSTCRGQRRGEEHPSQEQSIIPGSRAPSSRVEHPSWEQNIIPGSRAPFPGSEHHPWEQSILLGKSASSMGAGHHSWDQSTVPGARLPLGPSPTSSSSLQQHKHPEKVPIYTMLEKKRRKKNNFKQ